MSLGRSSLTYRTSLLVLTAVFVAGGVMAYLRMGRLEDPEFTIKQAQVITPYPGASAAEVESRVTGVIEKAAQQMGQLDYVKSTSQRGISQVDVLIKETYNKDSLPQVWDELRRKVADAQRLLPPGAGPSMVYDDFGDVFGVFFALTGDGYSMAELKQAAKFIQRELLTVQDVAKVELVGAQPEAVFVELSPAKMARFGVSRDQIYKTLQGRNLMVDAGEAVVGNRRVALRPTGDFTSVGAIEELLIVPGGGQSAVYLRDIAEVSRGYKDPASFKLRVAGRPAVGMIVSTVKGGNVVTMGEALKERMRSVYAQRLLPFGIEYHAISIQSDAVTVAISGFVNSLLQAVAIVVVVLLLFMGLRSGLIIGAVLLVTIIGSFVFMYGMGIMLERISLGALIIALGMLVDNAIVVTEGMLVRMRRGEDPGDAADRVVSQNAWPLLGATIVAVLAFAAIGASNDSSGEYTRSLFLVIMISLLFSWVTAVTLTPVLCALFLKRGAAAADGGGEAYDGAFFRAYRLMLTAALRRPWAVMALMAVLLGLSVFGFGQIETAFFPASTRPQLMVDFWLPEGTDFATTERRAVEAEEVIAGLENVAGVASFIGQGPPRYLLTLAPESPNTSYAHFLVSVDDHRNVDALSERVQRTLEERFPDVIAQSYKFALGPGEANKIQVRIQGPDPGELRRLAGRVADVMHADGRLIGIQTDWRDRVPEYRPVLRETQARQLGIERAAVANVLKETFEGRQVGVFQEGDEMLPILARAPAGERGNLALLESLTVPSPATGRQVPLGQLVSGYETVMADSIVKRRDRAPTLTVRCNPREGNASAALARLMPGINAVEMPPGYRLEYGGEYESSNKANAALQNKVLFCGLLMVLIVILLFNALRQPLVVWLCVPLSLIGVVVGLLVSGQPFGFMALLGLLSLSGMLIKNAIVLIDETDIQRRAGRGLTEAVVGAGVSRMRPVTMAAATTVLGMVPLLLDAFFVAMAVTIMAGLTFATVLTLIVVPVLYAMVFRGAK